MGYFDGAVLIRDTADGPVVDGPLDPGPEGAVDIAAYSPDGGTVATAVDGVITFSPLPAR
ncbi:hypothetical protein [Nocardia higoensis]|uniref:hypothetical protein n=1 Tax=Nocardia higoensis TaxID=228599 RepID=UPI000309D224|nr:hypothetical protein [Nocardia higoensis]